MHTVVVLCSTVALVVCEFAAIVQASQTLTMTTCLYPFITNTYSVGIVLLGDSDSVNFVSFL